MKKNILITGSTGFIGKNVLKKLHGEFNFIALTRNPNDKNGIFYDGTYESIEKGIGQNKIDVILHLATLFKSAHKSSEINDLINSNVTLGCHLAEWASKNNVHNFINFGSYAQSVDGINDISQNFYTATKTAFEKILEFYVQSNSLKCINLYLYDTYGPGDSRPKLINLILNALNKNEKLGMSPGDQDICYLYIDDVIEAIQISIERVLKLEIHQIEKFSLYSTDIVTVKNLVKKAEEVSAKVLQSDFGFYPYRKNEIMKFNPRYPILPNWRAKTNLLTGIQNILKEEK